ncbi:MAG: PilN domain-containing protein [Gammaproteobacteria bacterium]
MKISARNKRPPHTLLFVTEEKTFRADADRRGILLGEVETIEHGSKTTAHLARAFARIADGTGPLGRTLWILFMRLPALLVSVPTMQVRDVEPALLTQALQFEAEGMTGMSALESMVAFSFLQADNDMSDYWLAQIEQLAWDDLHKAVRQRKCRLGGVLNPGALPLALSDPGADEWLRLEAWASQLIAVHRSEARAGLQVFGFDSPHWRAELEQWLRDQEAVKVSETLLNSRIEMLPPTDRLLSLHNESDMTAWFGLWAQCLIRERGEGAAVLRPAGQVNMDAVWMGGSAIAALLLCGLHAGWFVYQQGYFENETKRLTQVEKDMVALRKQITEIGEQKDKLGTRLSKSSAEADSIPGTIRKLQERPALLLQALADNRDERLIVETLNSQGDQVEIGGVTLQPHIGNQLAGALGESLRDLNWKVDLPAKQNMELFDGEPGPWSFTLKLADQGIPGFAGPKPEAKQSGNKAKT